jgi:DNA-directed RNA polymerase specialized sigma24 family protein
MNSHKKIKLLHAKTSPAHLAPLVDDQVDRAVRGALRQGGWWGDSLADGLAEVRVRALESIRRGGRRPAPTAVGPMKAFCAKIAHDYGIDGLRKRDTDAQYCTGLCEDPDSYAPLLPSSEARDPVDAGRQLEVAAHLFRQGRMPEHGVDILEGIASECSYREVAEDLGIPVGAVEGRLRTMRRLFQRAIEERGLG